MNERANQIRKNADEVTADAIRRIHESGELRHLYGRPLDLDDDPDWLATRVLKQQGFSHPLIERGRELDEPRRAVDRLADRLRRRARPMASGEGKSAAEISNFNEWRASALDDYRTALIALNRAIRDFNLQAPEALHQRPIPVDESVLRLARDVPPAHTPCARGADQPHRPSLWSRLRTRY